MHHPTSLLLTQGKVQYLCAMECTSILKPYQIKCIHVYPNNCCYSLKIEKKKADTLPSTEGRMFGCFLKTIHSVCGVSVLCVCDILITPLERSVD